MANFFIRRPIVAIVISIIIVLLGVRSLGTLSFEQYPFLAPPTIRVTATYPGASAVAVEQSVATPVEQEVNGVEGSIYMKSSNTSDGRMQLDVNFGVGTNLAGFSFSRPSRTQYLKKDRNAASCLAIELFSNPFSWSCPTNSRIILCVIFASFGGSVSGGDRNFTNCSRSLP